MTYSELITTVKNLTQQRYQEYSRFVNDYTLIAAATVHDCVILLWRELAVYEQEIHKAVQDFYAARREMRRYVLYI